MRTLSVCTALLVFCGMVTTGARADEWSKRFDVSGKPELRVDADDAAIVLKAGPGSAIDARLTTKGWKIGPEGVHVNARQNGNRVEVEVRMPRGEWSFQPRSARLELIVPAELRADVRTGDGHVYAQGLKGELRFNTGDGGIDAESVDGAFTAHTGDGAVRVRGRFDLLDLRTNDGSIVAEAAPGSKTGSPWRIQTGDGSVTVRLPDGFAADLDASTGDGGISVNLPVTTSGFRSGDAFRGKLNGGGLPLRILTGDGAIKVGKL